MEAKTRIGDTMPTRAEKCISAIKTQCRILKENKIPFIFSAKPGKNVFSLGTKRCLDVLEKNSELFDEAFIGDIKLLCDPRNPPSSNEDIVNESGNNCLEKLNTPLSLANADEVKKYARYLIVQDRRVRLPESHDVKIKYGDKTWEASFWPNNLMKWTDIKKNFSNIKIHDFPGIHSILHVLREVVKRGLIARGKDPENYYDKNRFNKAIELKRKRNRGMHIPQGIIENDDCVSDTDPLDETSEQIFRPRRPMSYRGVISSPGEDTDLDSLSEEERRIESEDNNVHGPEGNSSVPDSGHRPNRPHLIAQLCNPKYLPLPDYLKSLAPGMKTLSNPGGGICLTSTIAQFSNSDVFELKEYANSHLDKNFIFYEGNLLFPLSVDIGTGENKRTKPIANQYEFREFLRSDDSIYSWNTGESEIIVLATIINQPITVVHFQQQGFPPGTPLEQRCDIKVYQPIERIERKSPYKQATGPWLLYEDLVHFSLLVPEDTVDPLPEGTGDSHSEGTGDSHSEGTGDSHHEGTGDSQHEGTGDSHPENTGDSHPEGTGEDSLTDCTGDPLPKDTGVPLPEGTGDSLPDTVNDTVNDDLGAFMTGFRSSIFPGEPDPNDNAGEPTITSAEHTQTSRHSNSSSSKLSSSSTPQSESSLSSSQSQPSCNDASSSQNVIRKSQRIRKRKIIYDNSELVCKKPRKNFLSQSVQELLKPQSSSVQRREILEHKRVENRRKESMLHEEEITMLETRKQAREKVKKKKDDHSKEVKLMAEDLRKNLSEQDINAMIKNNRKYYQKIEMGQQPSWRHKMFNYPTNKSKNERHLMTKLIAAPFSDTQQDQIFNQLQKIWLPNREMQLKNGRYFELVLLPEVYISIYQKFFHLPTKEIAESYIMDKGSMDPEDLSPESSLLIK